MRVFPLCPDCQTEYEDPLNRRFHAQPNACPVCGPRARLALISEQPSLLRPGLEQASNLSTPLRTSLHPFDSAWDKPAISLAAQLLADGKIIALKGLGGYHLACDALNETAVASLRQRKRREAKPFALMVPDLETARQLCWLNEAEVEVLQSRQRPIILLQQRPDCPVALVWLLAITHSA
jgi:hydrogenase maturation protein HypF